VEVSNKQSINKKLQRDSSSAALNLQKATQGRKKLFMALRFMLEKILCHHS
jgi:hypothetical protein